MEIELGKGIDKFLFGMTKQELISELGKPDKIYMPYDDISETYQYNSQRLEFTFEHTNKDLLAWIEIYNSEAFLFGKQLIGQKKKEVIKFINTQIQDTIEENDYGSFISLAYDEHWLELQFHFDRLTNINIGVLYDENSNPIWAIK